MTHPLKKRQQILSVREAEGLSYAETSKRFSVGTSSIQRWEKNPYPQKKRNKPATKIDIRALAEDVKSHPDAYPYERAQRLGIRTRGMCDRQSTP